MSAFTGGCCYSQECDRYTKPCGNCPILGHNKSWDLSRWVWQRKAKAWQNLKLTVVTPTDRFEWLPPPKEREWRTNDGVHLIRSDARDFAEFLRDNTILDLRLKN
jgi:hypothetical protein